MAAVCLRWIAAIAAILCTAAAQREGQLRLVGPRRNEGRVEVFHDGRWGTVCDDRFDVNDARVICRQLGFPVEPAPTPRHRGFYGPGSGPIWMDGLSCRGNENKLGSCRFNGWGRHDCRHSEDAGVVCSRPVSPALAELPLRVSCPPDHDGVCNTCAVPRDKCSANVAIAVQGILEARVRGRWHPVSGEGWNKANSMVACGQLGYPAALDPPSLDDLWPSWRSCTSSGSGFLDPCSNEQSRYLKGLSRIVLGHVRCDGPENTLLKCYYPVIGPVVSDDVSVATVRCTYPPDTSCNNPTAEVYRLRAGALPWMGRVEARRPYNGRHTWGTVCDYGWDLQEGNIICRSLGYGTAAEVFAGSNFGRGTGPVHFHQLRCTGNEKFLSKCKSNRRGGVCISHATDGGVRCHIPDRSSCPNEPAPIVRLSDVAHPQGRLVNSFVEVNHNGVWGRVCFSAADNSFLTVACRETRGQFAGRVRNDTDPSYTGVKYVGKFGCKGDELMASECSNNLLAPVRTCQSGYAIVDCTSELPDLVPHVTQFLRSLQYFPYVENSQISKLLCAKEENCLSSSADNAPLNSIRNLFRFTSLTMNYGRADFLPNARRHEWQYHTCHQHYHSFEEFIDYDILDLQGNKVAEGHKASFCLEDSICENVSPHFRCQIEQGISVNCGDEYGRHLDCQWIDVTGIKPGIYVLRQIVNAKRASFESDYLNNMIQCTIQLYQFGSSFYYLVDEKTCLLSDH